jgi:hypothetical protein
MGGIVRHIDHVLVRADDVAGLWDLFTRRLGLPVAWPPFEYQGFLSAAFSAGNTNVELLEPRSDAPEGAREAGGRPIGVAFEPYTVEEAVAGMEAAGVPHGDPWEFRLTPELSWQSTPLGSLPGCPIALFVKYRRDQDAYRAAMSAQIEASGGGVLGVTRFAGILFGAGDPAPWERLLGGGRSRWEIDGSFVELTDGTPAVTLEVRSLEWARERLADREMLGEADGRLELSFAGQPTGIALAEQTPPLKD